MARQTAGDNKTQVKAGNGLKVAAQRRKLFIDAYLTNGRNATQAAITAGYSEKTAGAAGSRLLKNVEISSAVDAVMEKAQALSGLTVDRTLQEVARLAYFDPRTLYREDGNLKRPDEWDDDTAAAVASLEINEEYEGKGDERVLAGFTKKLKLWDKNAALDKAMKHLGLYEKDNSQRGPDLALQIVMMGSA